MSSLQILAKSSESPLKTSFASLAKAGELFLRPNGRTWIRNATFSFYEKIRFNYFLNSTLIYIFWDEDTFSFLILRNSQIFRIRREQVKCVFFVLRLQFKNLHVFPFHCICLSSGKQNIFNKDSCKKNYNIIIY